MIKKVLIINGTERTIVVEGTESLAQVLRDRLLLTGCKIGCGEGHCGACNVIVDGKVTRSCITKIAKVPDYAKIETIEGIGTLDNLHPLQAAWVAHGCAQCGFCSPGFIMSAKVLLENNPSPTREEVRDWFNKNRNLCRCTGYKPLIDAVMDAAKVLRGEMTKEDLMFVPTDNKIIGTSYARPSGAAKVTGQWNFGADEIKNLPEDTLQIALVQAEVSHANIKGIDTAEAEKMPGVAKIITYKDVPGKNRITGLITFPTNKGDGWDRPILCDEKVFQYGDAIAMVCADTVEHAKAAAKAVKVDLEVLPAYMSAPEAMAPDAIEIHPGTPNVYYETNCIKGDDTAPIMETAPNVVEVEAYCSRQPHLPIEPDVAYAYTDEQGRITIHSKSIGIHLHHAMICEGIGVAPEKLRIVQLHAGGTFGYKFSPTIEALTGVATLVTGRPVALNFDMYQMITYTGKRSPGFMNIKLAADEKGKILALEGNNYIDHGPYSEFGDLLTLRLSQFVGAGMDIKNIRNKSQTVCTNHAYGAAFRGYGAPQSFMGGDIALDVMAAKMGIDPFEFRAMNCYKESEGSTTPNGCKPDVYCLEDLFDLARPKYQANKAYAEELNKTKSEDGKYKYGVGVSLGLDGVDSSEAWAELNEDNTVTIYNSWEDHGQGADIGTLTHAHETLRQAGFTPDRIKLVMNDTGLTPNSGPAGGSRSNVMSGNATRVACELLIDAMKKADGTFRTYDEMKAEGLALKYEGKWVATDCSDCDMETAQGNPFSVYMYCISLPVVRVEMATGKVKVVKFTMVSDFGTIINKIVVDGQVMGAIAQGIGLALSEDFEDLKKHTTLQRCGIPYPNDIPDDIELIYQTSHPRPLGPYGAAGCGEGPLAAPHPAILNAIYNATGARVTKIPARPEVVKAAIDAL